MSLRLRPLLTLVLTSIALQSVTAGQTMPAASQWIPTGAVISLELTRPRALLEQLAGERATAFVKALPAYQQQASNRQFQQFLAVVSYMESQLGTDWRTALAKLTGGGVTLAICPEETVILIVDAEDADMLGRLHETLLGIARSEAEKKGQPGSVASTKYGDVTAWTFDGTEAHAIIGKRLVISNRPPRI